jgi:hypothetical protein
MDWRMSAAMKPKFWMVIVSFAIGILLCLVVVVRAVQPTNKQGYRNMEATG